MHLILFCDFRHFSSKMKENSQIHLSAEMQPKKTVQALLQLTLERGDLLHNCSWKRHLYWQNHRTDGVGMSLWRCSPTFLLKAESVTESCPGLHPVRFWASPQLHWGTHPSVQPPSHSKNQNKPKAFRHSSPILKSSSSSKGQVSYKSTWDEVLTKTAVWLLKQFEQYENWKSIPGFWSPQERITTVTKQF